MSDTKPERCEWNPVLHQASWEPPLPTDCKNAAVMVVGTGHNNWHLCESCANDARFKLMKKRYREESK